MITYKLTLSYFGKNYLGWQIQPEKNKTIQGQLNKAMAQVTKSKDVSSIASGRTDAGVHALAQVVRVLIPFEIEPGSFLKGLNSKLPTDIKVISCELYEGDFHPIRDSLSKTYFYLFSNDKIESPLVYDQLVNIRGGLNLDLMKRASEIFLGEHDFCNFYCTGSEFDTSVKTILKSEISKFSHGLAAPHSNVYKFEITGNGFLKQMVRLIMGSIWAVGQDKVSLEQLKAALKQPVLKDKLAAVAPARGLYLSHVRYP